MTLSQFVVRNAFRNKRRSLLTLASIGVSLLLLTMLITIWRAFYDTQGTPESALRLITRHRVSLTFFIPQSYRERIRSIPGVVHVAPLSWFGGRYIDDRPENFFAQFATDEELFAIHPEWTMPPGQLSSWSRDRAGAAVSVHLADRYGWKLGDRITLMGTIFPVDVELTVRAIYEDPDHWDSVLFHREYIEEAVGWFKGRADTFAVLVDSPENVPRVAEAIDESFRNAPEPTKTETEKAFALTFVNMLGNVKAFILGISSAVVFTILLVSANTMAMSIRERIREVATLKLLGFTRRAILTFFVAEAVALALAGGLLGILAAHGLVYMVAHSGAGAMMLANASVSAPTMALALLIAAVVGFVSAIVPSYRASNLNIADGLRHLG
ncbi:MAG: ABC transporter permease [Terriglobales bacterium]